MNVEDVDYLLEFVAIPFTPITIIDTSNTWWYPSCTKCGRKTTPHNTTYYCDWCKWEVVFLLVLLGNHMGSLSGVAPEFYVLLLEVGRFVVHVSVV